MRLAPAPAPAAAEERLPPQRALPAGAAVGLVELDLLVAAVAVVGPLDDGAAAGDVDDGVKLGGELVGAAANLDVLGLLGGRFNGMNYKPDIGAK